MGSMTMTNLVTWWSKLWATAAVSHTDSLITNILYKSYVMHTLFLSWTSRILSVKELRGASLWTVQGYPSAAFLL